MSSKISDEERATARRLLIEAVMHSAVDHTVSVMHKLAACCPNCALFNEPMELCTYNKCNARPPAKVIAFSCGANFMHKDEIPF